MEIYLKKGHKLNNKYKILWILYSGEFSNVYLSEYNNKKYIIKECFPKKIVIRDKNFVFTEKNKKIFEGLKNNFKNEFKISKKLININGIYKIKEYIEENGTIYIIVNYITGNTLKEYIINNNLEFNEIINIFMKIVKIMKNVHDRGVLHLDLKPSNIIIDNKKNVNIIDFGLANSFKSKKVIFSNGYSALEMYSHRKKIDKRTDIYSIFCILYFMFMKKKPENSFKRYFLDEINFEKIDKYIEKNDFKMFLEKGMSVKKEDRYRNMREVEFFVKGFMKSRGIK